MPSKVYTPKNGKNTILNVDKVRQGESTQVRHLGTDEEYAQDLAELLEKGVKLPRVQVMRVDDERMKGDFVFDGNTTYRAHVLAKRKTIPATLYKGTYEELLQAVAQSNREHEKAGRKLTRQDKRRAVTLIAQAHVNTPMRSRPSNQEIAKAVGVSHTFVNNLDPFGRAGEKPPKGTTQTTAEPEEDDEESGDGTKTYDVSGDPIPPKSTPTPSNASAALFDWLGLATQMDKLGRTIDAMAETYRLKGTTEYVASYNSLDTLMGHVKKWREKHGKK